MGQVRLIPYEVTSIQDDTKKIPPGIEMIEAPDLWQQGYKGKGIVVAVLDTGCDVEHYELRDRIIGKHNVTSDDGNDPENVSDQNGHGTHVCGTIAATENDRGVIGVAPECQLLVVKVLSNRGFGTTEWVVEGIRHAINWEGPNGEKVQVLSMSLGGKENDPRLHDAIKEAVASGRLVVCAAGNDGDGNEETDEFAYPGAYPEVVQVGSVSLSGEISRFSNSNCKIDLVAPGEKILSTYPGDKFATLTGTSMATPHVTGAAALLIEKFEREFERKITEPELFAQLIKRTVSLSYSRKLQGNGLLKLTSGGSRISETEDRIETA
ncbi:S8 family peptidase [Halalkalibacterium halodurans]|uniref:S8 family peptidase n=1 Tax=Halalkalibacterium halodurans TaxID=86665 RepID=UPI002E214677|nr:S8 family peptidase [Halalkalibacterium halodurans]